LEALFVEIAFRFQTPGIEDLDLTSSEDSSFSPSKGNKVEGVILFCHCITSVVFERR
jgi:hypothetical protein